MLRGSDECLGLLWFQPINQIIQEPECAHIAE